MFSFCRGGFDMLNVSSHNGEAFGCFSDTVLPSITSRGFRTGAVFICKEPCCIYDVTFLNHCSKRSEFLRRSALSSSNSFARELSEFLRLNKRLKFFHPSLLQSIFNCYFYIFGVSHLVVSVEPNKPKVAPMEYLILGASQVRNLASLHTLYQFFPSAISKGCICVCKKCPIFFPKALRSHSFSASDKNFASA